MLADRTRLRTTIPANPTSLQAE